MTIHWVSVVWPNAVNSAGLYIHTLMYRKNTKETSEYMYTTYVSEELQETKTYVLVKFINCYGNNRTGKDIQAQVDLTLTNLSLYHIYKKILPLQTTF